MTLKKYIPPSVRLFLKIQFRRLKDYTSAEYKLFSTQKESRAQQFEYTVSITQSIRKNEHFENKIHNLSKGIDAINGIVIGQGEIFSFWKNVKKPTRKNGFQLSRNIVSGEIKEDYGGGLCQLSSIIYHLALISGWQIRERYNHSIDIYKEEDRFTPLGADATVVFGYKDLRIQNSFGFPVMISLSIDQDQLNCTFSASEKLTERPIEFHRKESGKNIEVNAFSNVDGQTFQLNKSIYKKK